MFTKPTYYYRALGVTEYATPAEITEAYKTLAKTQHPDHGGVAEMFTLITSAYNEIKRINAKKRGAGENRGDRAWYTEWMALAGLKPQTKYTTTRPNAYYSTPTPPKPRGTKAERCGVWTKSGACIRPEGHPHGHMSQSVLDTKKANAKAKRAAS